MSKIAGRLQKLAISTDGGSTYTDINGIVDADLAMENAELDTTTHDDTNSRSYIYGRFSGTINATLKWDDADTGQDTLITSFLNKTILDYRFRMETLVGAQEYESQGLVTALNPSGPNDDVAEMPVTIRLTGDITKAAQT